VALGYVALTITYTIVLRHVVVLDIVAIAGGFVLRAIGGGVAAPVGLSHWFLLVVTFSAVLVAAGKRYGELLRSSRQAAAGSGCSAPTAGEGSGRSCWWRVSALAPLMSCGHSSSRSSTGSHGGC
jgi:decaprenyl-phosphate phosphoribosyltransferase